MRLRKPHYIAILVGLGIIILDFIFFLKTKTFFFIFGLAILLSLIPFFIDLVYGAKKEKEKEEMFIEFVSDLNESVKTGIPISKSILNISKRNYKALDVHVKKLANQIMLGIPLKKALETFARDSRSNIIARTIELISQAERAGGKIESILESALVNVQEISEIKKKRTAAIHGMVMQGYIIFFIFLIIMVFVQLKFIPAVLSTLSGLEAAGTQVGGFGAFGVGLTPATTDVEFINNLVLALILMQGFFTGFVISKLSEGKLFAGLKHSFILMALSFLILEGAKLFIK
ncbi:MAG: type II secretion system F family protein [Candidatus Pacearchaeota archaeon]